MVFKKPFYNFILLKAVAEQVANVGKESVIDFINGVYFALDVKPFTTKTVDEIIEGYSDPLLKIAQLIDKNIKDDKFGLLFGVNYLFFRPYL